MTVPISEQRWSTIYKLYAAYSAPLYRVGASTHIAIYSTYVTFNSIINTREECYEQQCSFSLRRLFIETESFVDYVAKVGGTNAKILQEKANGKTVAE